MRINPFAFNMFFNFSMGWAKVPFIVIRDDNGGVGLTILIPKSLSLWAGLRYLSLMF